MRQFFFYRLQFLLFGWTFEHAPKRVVCSAAGVGRGTGFRCCLEGSPFWELRSKLDLLPLLDGALVHQRLGLDVLLAEEVIREREEVDHELLELDAVLLGGELAHHGLAVLLRQLDPELSECEPELLCGQVVLVDPLAPFSPQLL